MRTSTAPPLFGVYVHVPFCLTRCHYCDFVTYTGMEGLRRPYAAALLREAEVAAAGLGPEPPTVTSVFVGGGTPTLLPPGDLALVLDRLRGLLPFAPGAEVTVEANPETVDPAVAEGLAAEHVSAYALTIEPATKFGRLVAGGRMAAPDEDLLADRYEATCAALAATGYRHYEVSNWARDDRAPRPGAGIARLPARASRHNLTYWRRGAYLGLGAGAHEFTGGVRRWNVPAVPEYLAAVTAGRRPTGGEERLSAAEAAFELLALRLRTADGLDPAEAARLGVDPEGPAVAELRAAGLLAAGGRVALTEKGMFLHG